MNKTSYGFVFINCPFDSDYKSILYAIIYTVYHCGFIPRSSLEQDNALDPRLSKIEKLIEECRFGIHDLSRTEISNNGLPRFNMPFELGIFFGAKKFGDATQKNKVALVLERQKYQYQQFISDLSGIDTKAHDNKPETAIQIVRNWLKISSNRAKIDGHIKIVNDYNIFLENMPDIVKKLNLDINNLTYTEYCILIEEALSLNML